MAFTGIDVESLCVRQKLPVDAAGFGDRREDVVQDLDEALHAAPVGGPDAFVTSEEQRRESFVEQRVGLYPGIALGEGHAEVQVGAAEVAVRETSSDPCRVAGVVNEIHDRTEALITEVTQHHVCRAQS